MVWHVGQERMRSLSTAWVSSKTRTKACISYTVGVGARSKPWSLWGCCLISPYRHCPQQMGECLSPSEVGATYLEVEFGHPFSVLVFLCYSVSISIVMRCYPHIIEWHHGQGCSQTRSLWWGMSSDPDQLHVHHRARCYVNLSGSQHLYL